MAHVEGVEPLASILGRNRTRFNSLFATTQFGARPIDRQAFIRHMRERVNAALQRCDSVQVDAAGEALFALSCESFASGLLGETARYPLVEQIWESVLPHLVRLVDLRSTVAQLSNAAVRISQEGPQAGAAWIAGLVRVAPHCRTADEVMRCSSVAAWGSGLAQYRESALGIWESLPNELKGIVLGSHFAGISVATLERNLQDRWADPAAKGEGCLEIVARAGAFRGFGGQFLAPPQVASDGQRLLVHDYGSTYALCADFFGATFLRVPDNSLGTLSEGDGKWSVSPRGEVHCAGYAAMFPELDGWTSHAATADTLALTFADSHRLALVAVKRR